MTKQPSLAAELRQEIEELTRKLQEKDALLASLRPPGHRACEAVIEIREGLVIKARGESVRQAAARKHGVNDCYVQWAMKLYDGDRELFESVRQGKLKLRPAMAVYFQRHAEIEAKYKRNTRKKKACT